MITHSLQNISDKPYNSYVDRTVKLDLSNFAITSNENSKRVWFSYPKVSQL